MYHNWYIYTYVTYLTHMGTVIWWIFLACWGGLRSVIPKLWPNKAAHYITKSQKISRVLQTCTLSIAMYWVHVYVHAAQYRYDCTTCSIPRYPWISIFQYRQYRYTVYVLEYTVYRCWYSIHVWHTAMPPWTGGIPDVLLKLYVAYLVPWYKILLQYLGSMLPPVACYGNNNIEYMPIHTYMYQVLCFPCSHGFVPYRYSSTLCTIWPYCTCTTRVPVYTCTYTCILQYCVYWILILQYVPG